MNCMKDSLLKRLAYYISLGMVGGGGLCLNHAAMAAPAIQGYMMQVQLTPATCAIDSSKQRQRKCLEGYSLTIDGVWPETSASNNCATASSGRLAPLQAKVVARVMPDEGARIQLWRSIGGCIPMNASQYFRMVINLADKLKVPNEMVGEATLKVQHNAIRTQFLRLNPSLPAAGLKLNCQSNRGGSVLTEIQICYTSKGQYKACNAHVVANCPASFTIKGSY